MSGNQDQIDYWNGPAGQRWAEAQESLDRTLLAISAALLSFVAVKSGEHVLDVGCGCGTTTLAYAEAAGREGKIVGVDISGPMLALARQRAGSRPIQFIQADASVHPFKAEFDVVASRFGVMFFADPAAAFANIRKSLKPGGRLRFVCWRAMMDNQWATAPLLAARDLLPAQEPPDPNAPGPFAFADSARLNGILADAGFKNIKIAKLDSEMRMAPNAREAAQFSLGIGPLARASAECDDATKAKIVMRVAEAMKKFETPTGVAPPAACWLVGASA
ncbi:MAG TPA: class I SAM-dependent methyltransferase [Rhizomicrobium sp.]|nr:class I SAM-dependent methyltransferase [Rhizomicrobium sp.]